MLATMALFGNQAAAAEAAGRPVTILFNERQLELEKDPVITNGTTLVPFRPLFEAMGIKVEWNQAQQIVTGTADGYTLQLQVGSNKAVVNGKTLTMSEAPRLVDGYTLVPVRFISESTGSLVAWNPYSPQVIVYTESFIASNGATREQVQDMVDKELARIKAEYEAAQAANQPPEPIAVPEPPQGSGVYKPAVSDSVDVSKLQGMYYGFRDDNGGYECGGMCWDMFTFLQGSQVIVGPPVNGGPETIDCGTDSCQSYTISNGTLTLGNGERYSIKVEGGTLFIDDVEMERVRPANADLKLTDEYVYRGYTGLAGISAGSTSWTNWITFYDNGTFKSNRLMLGSVQGGAPTQGAAGGETTGSYRISGNTLVLAYQDGTVENLLFFVHNDSAPGQNNNIQIGENYFYIDED